MGVLICGWNMPSGALLTGKKVTAGLSALRVMVTAVGGQDTWALVEISSKKS